VIYSYRNAKRPHEAAFYLCFCFRFCLLSLRSFLDTDLGRLYPSLGLRCFQLESEAAAIHNTASIIDTTTISLNLVAVFPACPLTIACLICPNARTQLLVLHLSISVARSYRRHHSGVQTS
jgi:hypothetical protein